MPARDRLEWFRWNPADYVADFAVRLVDEPAGADERWFNDDIVGLDTAALKCERVRLLMALSLTQRPCVWAEDRLRRIEDEVKARRSRPREVECD